MSEASRAEVTVPVELHDRSSKQPSNTAQALAREPDEHNASMPTAEDVEVQANSKLEKAAYFFNFIDYSPAE